MEGVLVSVSRAMAELAAADRQRILELEAEVERLREALDGRGQQLAQAQMQRDEAWAEVERPTSDTTGKVGYVETTSKATFPTATADGGTVLVTSADVIGDGVSGPEILRRLEDVSTLIGQMWHEGRELKAENERLREALRDLADEAAYAPCYPRFFYENEGGRQQRLSRCVAAARLVLNAPITDPPSPPDSVDETLNDMLNE
jgi:regulator of replication initiation timing